MAGIAVGLATKQAEGLIDKLYATVSGELSSLLGVREEIRFIKDELEVMSAFLQKAEEKQDKDQLAKAWVKQVKELAYAVEDCIDEFSLHLPCRSNNINRMTALWRRARSVGSPRARRRIAVNIQSIKSRVKEVSERRLRYGIDEKASSIDMDVAAQYDPRLSALFANESQLIGIDEPLNKLVKWLLDESKPRLRSIGVVGGGGLGKTTIVKRAYENPQVAGGYFHCRAWITVSQVYHIEELLRSMIKQFFPSLKDEDLNKITDRAKLVQKLRDHLKDKRYAIVFDDIWKIDAWKRLEDILQHNELGSRIIITTRNKEVFEDCMSRIPGDIHEQEKLNKEDSWKLLCKRVFPEQQTCSEELRESSEAILQKCDGSPLAIIAIAATLAGKNSKDWEGFLKHISSELESNPNLQGVMKILKFSFTDLSYHVQRCFLYLSRFPEDSVINCKRIKRLWMAEGLISAHRDMSTEEVAESYLNMLINRSMILPSKFSVHGEIRGFTIHDIMMEMIVSISAEENFVCRMRKDSTWLPQGVIRRLSMDSGSIPDDLSLSYLRSMVLFGDSVPSSLFVSPPFKLLRVLDLDGCRYVSNNHLDGVCQLLHLKYLSLRKIRRVTRIPKSIGRLQNLETFDIRGCCWRGAIEIPVEIEKLKRLQLLRGTGLRVPTKLNLRELTALQELGTLRMKHAKGEKKLKNLYHLRKLHVRFVRNYPKRGAYLCESLKTMRSSLRSLKVVSKDDLNFLKVALSRSPVLALESLHLKGSLDALPNWVSSLTNLTKLTLITTRLGADAIEALGTLPKLIQLSLWGPYNEERLCFSAESFKSLKSLALRNIWLGSQVFEIRSGSLVFEIGAMPCLERARLTEVGSYIWGIFLQISGVDNLIGLKMIELYRCPDGVENSVKQAVEAHPNNPQLIISDESFTISSSVRIT